MIRGSWGRRDGDKMEEKGEDGIRQREGTRMVKGDGGCGQWG